MRGTQKVKFSKPPSSDLIMNTAKSSNNKSSVKAHKLNANAADFKKSKLSVLQSKKAFLGLKNFDPSIKTHQFKVQQNELKSETSRPYDKKAGYKPLIGKPSSSRVLREPDTDSNNQEDDSDDDEFDNSEHEEDDDSDMDNYDEDSIDEELSDESCDLSKVEKEQMATIKLTKPVSEAVVPKSILKTGSALKATETMKISSTMTKKSDSSSTSNAIAVKSNQKVSIDSNTSSERVVSKVASKSPVKASTTTSAASALPITKAAKASQTLTLIARPGAENLTTAQRSEFDHRVRSVEKCTVFLKGLHRRCTETDLRRIVKDVITIRLPLHAKKGSKIGRNRGFAFLEFADEQTARRNIRFLNEEAKLLNSEGQPSKLEANVSGDRGHAMSADDWNFGSLYIVGLPEAVGEDEIAALFDRQEVVAVVLPRNRADENQRAAHVRFKSVDACFRQFDAARAKLMRREFALRGRLLSIAFSSIKQQHGQQKHPEPGPNAPSTSPATTVATATTIMSKKPVVTNRNQDAKSANVSAAKKDIKPIKAGLKHKLDEETKSKSPKSFKPSIRRNLFENADDDSDIDDDGEDTE